VKPHLSAIAAIAARLGVRVEIDDLGEWGAAALIAEYDPDGPVIRVNRRMLPAAPSAAFRAAIDRAVAHELYHRCEDLGTVPRLRGLRARERAAEAFAAQLCRS